MQILDKKNLVLCCCQTI